MNAVYIGILTPGTTSRMRAETLRTITPRWHWHWIDTHKPYLQASRWGRTLAMRFKIGPVMQATNRLVQNELAQIAKTNQPDLIWTDKAAYLSLDTTKLLRRSTGKLIHYTPDTAFHTNKSKAFNASLPLYDYAVSTKSFETAEYAQWIPADRLLMTTQAYDAKVHYPRFAFEEKVPEVSFIGLCEPDRMDCAEQLLAAGVPLRIAGVNWEDFCQRHQHDAHFSFAGREVFGDDYVNMISKSWISLGLISKRFPELHTTRTFEIPACGTILATETNRETQSFFNDDEALFFTDYQTLAQKIKALLQDPEKLRAMASAGTARVRRDQRDYHSILSNILAQTGTLSPS
ncbi:CgeB family protein [Cerasicoccus fimbriatus]|uniref:CgeB family protein n=1 Tax=Cerasicoccus fimbriatus TaxID=3014554 RepID=UPI0022B3B298|nr:glycosyltransferase [Cerasicoccus sp. TK19100]